MKNVTQIAVTASNAAQRWRKKRDRLFEQHGLVCAQVYDRGEFLALPAEILMAVCYVDAFESVRSWCRSDVQFEEVHDPPLDPRIAEGEIRKDA